MAGSEQHPVFYVIKDLPVLRRVNLQQAEKAPNAVEPVRFILNLHGPTRCLSKTSSAGCGTGQNLDKDDKNSDMSSTGLNGIQQPRTLEPTFSRAVRLLPYQASHIDVP